MAFNSSSISSISAVEDGAVIQGGVCSVDSQYSIADCDCDCAEWRISGASENDFSVTVGSVRAEGREVSSVITVVGLGDVGDGRGEYSLFDGELEFQEKKVPSLAKAGESGDLGTAAVSTGADLSDWCFSTLVMEISRICVVVLAVVVVVVVR